VMSRGQEDRVCSVLVFMPGLDFISCEFDGWSPLAALSLRSFWSTGHGDTYRSTSLLPLPNTAFVCTAVSPVCSRPLNDHR
jgi:hypothetical protein